MRIFIAKVEWYDEGIHTDTFFVAADDFVNAMESIINYYDDTLCCIHYLEPWDKIVHIDDDFMRDIEKVRSEE